MLRAYKIPPLLIFTAVLGIAFAQLCEGTDLYFAAMMALTLLCIGFTYNLLEGLSTLSGITFATMTLRWVVISQIAKICVLQPADRFLDAPELTVSVYGVFFLCLLLGVFFYRHVHVRLPPIWEPQSSSRAMILYAIALPVGIVGEVIFNVYNIVYSDAKSTSDYNNSRSIGLALTGFLLFALVLAIDRRIRRTNGRHSFGIAAFIPWVAVMLFGFINTQRQTVVEPTALYFVACYFRRYRFRARHIVAAICFAILFDAFISPLELYTRTIIRGANFTNRIYLAFHTLENASWGEIEAAAAASSLLHNQEGSDYYELPGTRVLNRLSEIRMDSNLIAATASYHYGFESIKIDLLEDIPRVLDKHKPDYDSADFLGRVAGVTGDLVTHSSPAFTMVSDSFGSFGWFGVVVIALIVLPLTFRVYESMFDISRPWGTVALLTCVMWMPEGGAGRLVATLLLRSPLYLFLASWMVGILTSFIPTQGESTRSPRIEPSLPFEPGAAPAD